LITINYDFDHENFCSTSKDEELDTADDDVNDIADDNNVEHASNNTHTSKFLVNLADGVEVL
jgi:hypothetical protein